MTLQFWICGVEADDRAGAFDAVQVVILHLEACVRESEALKQQERDVFALLKIVRGVGDGAKVAEILIGQMDVGIRHARLHSRF